MGQAHGHGIETNPDGSIRHDGEWQYDTPIRRWSYVRIRLSRNPGSLDERITDCSARLVLGNEHNVSDMHGSQ